MTNTKSENTTNTRLLQEKIDDSGLKKGYLVEQLQTSYAWLNKKINNEVPFNACEIQALCEILGIVDLKEKERIFFAKNVE